MKNGQIPTADVCLFAESIYPYRSGGVSTWIHDIIRSLPDVRFTIVCIWGERNTTPERIYELPDNVVCFLEIYLQEVLLDRRTPAAKPSSKAWSALRRFHARADHHDLDDIKKIIRHFGGKDAYSLSSYDCLHSSTGWDLLRSQYDRHAPGSSFNDYFWVWREVHEPLIAALAAEIPPASIYHAATHGYSGLMAAVAKIRTQRPFLLTEHGCFVLERSLDFMEMDWLYERPERVRVPEIEKDPLRGAHRRHNAFVATFVYDVADEIFPVCDFNRQHAIKVGTDPKKITVVPNGIDIGRYGSMRDRRRPDGRPQRVGFVGRVECDKDLITLVQACRIISQELPKTEFWIVGPWDKEYYEQCREMVTSLRLEESVSFLGRRDTSEIYPEIDVLLMTSVLEVQPLVILEAACAGVPTVTTDTGACRELVEGTAPEDVALGPSGMVVGLADPEATALATIKILTDDELRSQLAASGVERAERFYSLEKAAKTYGSVYNRYLQASSSQCRR